MNRMNETNTPYVDYEKFQEINRLLAQAGKLADQLTQNGYTLKMSLWGRTFSNN
ncbi:hypothetical protein [Caulobacter phage Cr30]|uniref:hypothetical protein n=1 Tax=Caulobacter phage Cr30 TaxID=1357714 RepID=UPI0004A9B8DD|nr:hypothetical protein OZ74_gp171 [Caulobacter phage Cr30]AGS81056.1 hypothetical protein [Caulobacter phage Cr30]